MGLVIYPWISLPLYTLKTPGWILDPAKGPLGPNSIPGLGWSQKSVIFMQTWQIMGSDWPSSGSYSASGWLISGSSLTRNGVWPQWTLSGSTWHWLFLECTIQYHSINVLNIASFWYTSFHNYCIRALPPPPLLEWYRILAQRPLVPITVQFLISF